MPRALTSQKIPPLTDTRSLGQRAWLDTAACATMPVDQSDRLFFPRPNARLGDAIWDDARAICEGCPVRDACLADAMKAEEGAARYGYRGGKTPDERYAIGAPGKRASMGGSRRGPLTPEEDAAIASRYRSGQSARAIAATFGLSPTTVTKSLHRAGVAIRTATTKENAA